MAWISILLKKPIKNKTDNFCKWSNMWSNEKTGLFPQKREEQAHRFYCENARFQEILRENKRKTEIHTNLRFF